VWLPTLATLCNAGAALTHRDCHGASPCEEAKFATPKAYPRSGQTLPRVCRSTLVALQNNDAGTAHRGIPPSEELGTITRGLSL
jgi:hypothetical protein